MNRDFDLVVALARLEYGVPLTAFDRGLLDAYAELLERSEIDVLTETEEAYEYKS